MFYYYGSVQTMHWWLQSLNDIVSTSKIKCKISKRNIGAFTSLTLNPLKLTLHCSISDCNNVVQALSTPRWIDGSNCWNLERSTNFEKILGHDQLGTGDVMSESGDIPSMETIWPRHQAFSIWHLSYLVAVDLVLTLSSSHVNLKWKKTL